MFQEYYPSRWVYRRSHWETLASSCPWRRGPRSCSTRRHRAFHNQPSSCMNWCCLDTEDRPVYRCCIHLQNSRILCTRIGSHRSCLNRLCSRFSLFNPRIFENQGSEQMRRRCLVQNRAWGLSWIRCLSFRSSRIFQLWLTGFDCMGYHRRSEGLQVQCPTSSYQLLLQVEWTTAMQIQSLGRMFRQHSVP